MSKRMPVDHAVMLLFSISIAFPKGSIPSGKGSTSRWALVASPLYGVSLALVTLTAGSGNVARRSKSAESVPNGTAATPEAIGLNIGDRKRVVWGKSVSVRVDL